MNENVFQAILARSPDLEYYGILTSSLRWFLGLLIGTSTAFVLAGLCATSTRLIMAARTTLSIFKAMPILALMPVFSKYIGMGEVSKIMLISWASFFPTFFTILSTFTKTPEDIERRLSVARLSLRSRTTHYYVPRLLRGYLAGVETSMGIAWITVVAAEMIGTSHQGFFRGGWDIRHRQRLSNVATLYRAYSTFLSLERLGSGAQHFGTSFDELPSGKWVIEPNIMMNNKVVLRVCEHM